MPSSTELIDPRGQAATLGGAYQQLTYADCAASTSAANLDAGSTAEGGSPFDAGYLPEGGAAREHTVKLLPKLALLSIGVAAVPLAIAGYSSIRVSQAALREAIEGNEVLLARQIAEYVSSQLGNLHSTMAVETRILDLTRVGDQIPHPEALRKFLQLVYHQNDDFSIVALLDKEGRSLVPPAFQSVAPRNDSYGDHEIIDRADPDKLPASVPIEQVLRDGAAVVRSSSPGRCRVPMSSLPCATTIPAPTYPAS